MAKTPEKNTAPTKPIETGTAVAVANEPGKAVSLSDRAMALGGFKIKKKLTFPQLKIVDDREYAITCNSNVYDGKEIAAKRTGEIITQKARLMNVKNLHDNQEYQMIVNAVLEGVFRDEAGAKLNEKTGQLEGLEGRSFVFLRSPVEGKRYKAFQVIELEKV